MKHFIALALIVTVISLPACCWRKKQCCPQQPVKQEEVVVVEKHVEKRVSGPFPKGVIVSKEDYK